MQPAPGQRPACLGSRSRVSRYPALAFWAVAIWPARLAVAEEVPCFDFASPTLDALLQPSRVQRMLLFVLEPEPATVLASKSLARAAQQRGVEVIMREATIETVRDKIPDEASRSRAQMVAAVRVRRGAEGVAAAAFVRDQTGVPVAQLAGVPAEPDTCREREPAAPPAENETGSDSPATAPSRRPMQIYETPSPGKSSRRSWYGWQLILADLGTFALLASPVPYVSLVTYVVAPAAIHAANAPHGRIAWSLALRLGLPLAGAGLGLLSVSGGACNSSEQRGVCSLAMVVGSFFLGAIAAVIIDGSALAWKRTYETDDNLAVADTHRRRKASSIAIGAGPIPLRNGVGIGLTGRL